MTGKTRWVWGGIALSICLMVFFVFAFRESFLLEAGKFMAPQGDYVADVAILEGSEFIDRDLIGSGLSLLRSGRVKRLFVVLHNIAHLDRPFGFNNNYADLVKQGLEDLGLKQGEFKIIVTHIHDPFTLTEAQGVMKALSDEGIQSAILLAPGFHTRRSFLVYQYLGLQTGIRIFPDACFDEYMLDKWWTQEIAVRDFVSESLKLGYYLIRGYIPFKFSY
jgi:hypothetical protein